MNRTAALHHTRMNQTKHLVALYKIRVVYKHVSWFQYRLRNDWNGSQSPDFENHWRNSQSIFQIIKSCIVLWLRIFTTTMKRIALSVHFVYICESLFFLALLLLFFVTIGFKYFLQIINWKLCTRFTNVGKTYWYACVSSWENCASAKLFKYFFFCSVVATKYSLLLIIYFVFVLCFASYSCCFFFIQRKCVNMYSCVYKYHIHI